jgi:CRISPR-associated protein Csb2
MSHTLVVHVSLHDARYHGVPDWPPSPARLFQSLVAAAAKADGLANEDSASLEWLEQLPSPIIAAPIARQTRGFVNYVPNNDLDSKGGDPARVSEIRVAKLIKPRLLESNVPIRYFWAFAADRTSQQFAERICSVAERLYQLGRGVDMAWAWGEVLEDPQARQQLNEHRGTVHHPSSSGSGATLACPEAGSLRSLIERYRAHCRRFTYVHTGTKIRQVFAQPPKPRFRLISYDDPPRTKLYDLVGELAPWPLVKASELVKRVRDASAKRLTDACPEMSVQVERVLIGRGATSAEGSTRVRIIPIPSIGNSYADRAIRRVLVRIPPGCPICAEDIDWAFSGSAPPVDGSRGEALLDLVPANDYGMLRHYGVPTGEGSRCWRTVTPAVLPEAPIPQRMDRQRRRDQRKGGNERAGELNRAASAVLQALRHANVRARVNDIRIQREPFDAKGARAEAFCTETRFAGERLWHVQIRFAERVPGPLIIGDGRYAGLGLMAPVRENPVTQGIFCFAIVDGLSDSALPLECASALRRAVMSCAQQVIGYRNRLPLFFTGHELNGAPARNGTHSHLAFAADLTRNRLLVIAPHVLERRLPKKDERRHLDSLHAALSSISGLRAGSCGRLRLEPAAIDPDSDPLLAPSQRWESVTHYVPTRYLKRVPSNEAVATDLLGELRRLKMPAPANVDTVEVQEGPRGGLQGRLRLRFATAVSGLVLIGRTRHFGGGLFSGVVGTEH